jgi:hypothetical protein
MGDFAHHLGRDGGGRVLGAQRPLVVRSPAHRALGRRTVVAGAIRRTCAAQTPAGGLLTVALMPRQSLGAWNLYGWRSYGPEEEVGGIAENETGER